MKAQKKPLPKKVDVERITKPVEPPAPGFKVNSEMKFSLLFPTRETMRFEYEESPQLDLLMLCVCKKKIDEFIERHNMNFKRLYTKLISDREMPAFRNALYVIEKLQKQLHPVVYGAGLKTIQEQTPPAMEVVKEDLPPSETEQEAEQAQYEAEQMEHEEQQRRYAEQEAREAQQQAMHDAEQEALGQMGEES